MKENTALGLLGDRDGVIWFNGELTEWREAKVHVLSHSLHHGSAIFDGLRVYNGHIFRPDAHIERMIRSTRSLGFDLPCTPAALMEAMSAVVAHNKIIDGYIRPLIWRGPGGLDISPLSNLPNVAIAAWPLGSFIKNDARLLLAQYRRPHPQAGPWRIKAAGNYLAATLAKARARTAGYDDALMLSWRGTLADTTGTNIALVSKGRIHMPKPDGFFAGITMQTVKRIAINEGIDVVISHIPVSALAKADALFLMGTAAGIVPVAEVFLSANRHYLYGQNPILQRIKKKYELTSQAGI